MRIIDAHQHFWKKELFANKLPSEMSLLVNDYQPDDLKPLIDQTGVSQTVLVQTHSSFQNTLDFIEIADQHDWIGAVVGWVDLADPNISSTLDSLEKYPKLKGLRHQWEDESDPAWILRPDILRGLEQVAKHDYSYDVLAKPPNWKYISGIAEAVPDLPLVIDHIAKPNIRIKQFKEWDETMAQAARYPQIMLKLSGMVMEADWHKWKPQDLKPYIVRGIELFGFDRVMFGSDWPVCLLAGSYKQVFEAVQECLSGFNEADCRKLFYENAKKFYRISEIAKI
jgi:L-fuconolactonase